MLNLRLQRRTVRRALADCGLLVLGMTVVIVIAPHDAAGVLPAAGPHLVSLAAATLVVNSAAGLYRRLPNPTLRQTVLRAALALIVALPLTYALFSLLAADLPSRSNLRLAAMLGVALVVVRRACLAGWAQERAIETRILIYGTGPPARAVADTFRQSDPASWVVGHYPSPNESALAVPGELVLPTSRSLAETVRRLQVDEIVVALAERRGGSMPLRELLDCKLAGIRVRDANTHFEKSLGQIPPHLANAGWMIFGGGFDQGPVRAVLKRAFDIVLSLLLMVPAVPIMAIAAVLIRWESAGPVLYRQERVGLHGRRFQLTKFRSMRVDAEPDGQPRWASVGDARVTRVGRVMRRLRVDELPQLFTVLTGQMSLVGPRPERPFFVDQLTRQIPYFAVRQSVKPGLTGWAQVRCPYGATAEEWAGKLQYDLYYVKNHSLVLDARILLETVVVVLTGRGAR